MFLAAALSLLLAAEPESPRCEAELVFPLHAQHNHAPGIVECPNGDLLVSWYRGAGERSGRRRGRVRRAPAAAARSLERAVPDGGSAGISRLQHVHDDRRPRSALAVLADDPGQQLGIVPDELSCGIAVHGLRAAALGPRRTDSAQAG